MRVYPRAAVYSPHITTVLSREVSVVRIVLKLSSLNPLCNAKITQPYYQDGSFWAIHPLCLGRHFVEVVQSFNRVIRRFSPS